MLAWVLFAAACACGIGPSGQLAFVSGTTQDEQRVCVLDAASGVATPIGPGRYDADPVWSPDGQQLAFSTATEKGVSIAVVNADGSGLRMFQHARAWNRYPRWAPHGKALAYVAISDDAAAPDQVCAVLDLQSGTESVWGGELKTIMRPVWMPNVLLLRALAPQTGLLWGKERVTPQELLERLAASGALVTPAAVGEHGKMSIDIFFLDPTTASPLFQAALPSQGAYAEWAIEPSPNGAAVAMESNDGGDREVFVFSKTGMTDVSNHRAPDWNPVWSPDSRWLAFESLRDGRRGVYRVYTETARVLPLAVSSDGDSWSPTWSPDGKWVAFVSNRTGDDEIYVVPVEAGQQPVRLTQHPGIDHSPTWRPKAKP